MNIDCIKTTNGNLFFYTNTGTTLALLSTSVKMTETVDRDILEKAVETAMKRYPYFCVRPVIANGAYYLAPNDLPFVVTDDGEFTPLGVEASNYHLLTFTCKDKEIFINFDHALSDGRGSIGMMYSVLYYYCVYKYGRDFNCPGVQKADDPVAENEYQSTYEAEVSLGNVPELRTYMPVFTLPDRQLLEDKEEYKVYAISVKQTDFMRVAKMGDSSPGALGALLLMRAVDKIHPNRDKNLVCYMAVDYRNAVGMDHTHQSAYTLIPIHYHDRMKDMSIEKQNICTRGQVILQSDPDQIRKLFTMEKQLCEQVLSLETLEEKQAAYKSISPFCGNIFCSYVGQTHFGEIEDYIESVHFLNGGVAGILLEITSVGENFGLDISFGIDNTEYLDAFLQQLQELNIPYKIDREFRLKFPVKNY